MAVTGLAASRQHTRNVYVQHRNQLLKKIHLWKKDYCLGIVLSIILMGNFNLQLIIRTEKSKLRRSTGKKVANKF